MSRPIKFATTVANLGISGASQGLFLVGDHCAFMGLAATNSTGAPYYVKLLWTGQVNLSYAQISAVITNAACTLVPSLTIEVPTIGFYAPPAQWPISEAGQLYMWATSTAADATNTSLASGGDALTVFID